MILLDGKPRRRRSRRRPRDHRARCEFSRSRSDHGRAVIDARTVAPAVAHIALDSTPRGAFIELDGKPAGTTPVEDRDDDRHASRRRSRTATTRGRRTSMRPRMRRSKFTATFPTEVVAPTPPPVTAGHKTHEKGHHRIADPSPSTRRRPSSSSRAAAADRDPARGATGQAAGAAARPRAAEARAHAGRRGDRGDEGVRRSAGAARRSRRRRAREDVHRRGRRGDVA